MGSGIPLTTCICQLTCLVANTKHQTGEWTSKVSNALLRCMFQGGVDKKRTMLSPGMESAHHPPLSEFWDHLLCAFLFARVIETCGQTFQGMRAAFFSSVQGHPKAYVNQPTQPWWHALDITSILFAFVFRVCGCFQWQMEVRKQRPPSVGSLRGLLCSALLSEFKSSPCNLSLCVCSRAGDGLGKQHPPPVFFMGC